MAQYKIQRAKGVEGSTIYTYTAPGHNECVPTRLHDPADVDGGKMIQGITYFIPGGGCDYGANPCLLYTSGRRLSPPGLQRPGTHHKAPLP